MRKGPALTLKAEPVVKRDKVLAIKFIAIIKIALQSNEFISELFPRDAKIYSDSMKFISIYTGEILRDFKTFALFTAAINKLSRCRSSVCLFYVLIFNLRDD